MHSTENREEEGMAGSNTPSPERQDVLDRTETSGGVTTEVADLHAPDAEKYELPSGSHRQLHNFQSSPVDLEGFSSPVWIPEDYQVRGVKWLSQRIGSALFLPPGFGKTSITLAAQQQVRNFKPGARMLVIAPLTAAVTTWMAEPRKWKQFSGLKVGLARGPLREEVALDRSYDIVVTNYDSLSWLAPLLARGGLFDILVCDELTRLKHINSKRFKLLKPLLPFFTFRWGLTGTPAANGLLDLFGQIFILDLGQRLGRYITHFRMKYFYQKPWDIYKYYISDESADKLIKQISDICMYMDPAEYLHLPPLIDIIKPVVTNATVMKQYKELENEFILALKMGVVTAANAGVLTSKLRQFTGGGIYLPGGDSWAPVHDDKLTALVDLVDELNGEPLMVAYQFEHEFERLHKQFTQALYIKGGMTKNQLQKTIEEWNTGVFTVLLVQPSAAALGLNLQFGGHILCWFTLTYNLEEYIQLIARLLRRGQTKNVINYILTIERTIDQVVAQVLVDKDITQNKVFSALQQLKV